jgi:hypothetical protein
MLQNYRNKNSTVLYKKTMQTNGIVQNPEISPCSLSQLILNKGGEETAF